VGTEESITQIKKFTSTWTFTSSFGE